MLFAAFRLIQWGMKMLTSLQQRKVAGVKTCFGNTAVVEGRIEWIV